MGQKQVIKNLKRSKVGNKMKKINKRPKVGNNKFEKQKWRMRARVVLPVL